MSDLTARQMVTEILDSGGKALSVVEDIGEAESAMAVVEAPLRSCGGVDVLVNNAGISHPKGRVEITEEEWDRTIAVSVKGRSTGAEPWPRPCWPSGPAAL